MMPNLALSCLAELTLLLLSSFDYSIIFFTPPLKKNNMLKTNYVNDGIIILPSKKQVHTGQAEERRFLLYKFVVYDF